MVVFQSNTMDDTSNGSTGIPTTDENSPINVKVIENNSDTSKKEKTVELEKPNADNNNSPVVCGSQPTSVTTTALTLSVSSPESKPPVQNPIPKSPAPPPPPPAETKPRRGSEVATRSSCPVCHVEAVKKKNALDVLKCGTCNNFVHFACTNLPPYMLYSLSSSNKKYTCEGCAETPEPFLTSIVTKICNASEISKSPTSDNRIDILEHKVSSIMVSLEKFDLQTLTDNLNTLGTKMETTNNNMTGNVRAIQQLKKDQAASVTDVKPCNGERHISGELEQLRMDLEVLKKDLAASHSSNELLIASVTERDKALASLRDKFDKNVLKLNEQNRRLTLMDAENNQLKDANMMALNEKAEKSGRSEEWSFKVQTLSRERDQYFQKLEETQNKFLEVRHKLDTTLEVNVALKEQIKELVELNKTLQLSINRPSDVRNILRERRSDRDQNDSEDEEEESARDEVVILHDSMCAKVNDTLLSRENVRVKKVWAPDFERMEDSLDDVNAKVVVLEALTRDLAKMEVEEMNQKIVGLVSKAVTKADKVVLSTIIRREDIDDIDLKADLVNAHIKLKYKRNEDVIICDNYALYDTIFRKEDKLHLNDDGVKIFASNMKYAIAEAVGVQVKQKQRKGNYNQRYENGDRREQRNNNFGRRSR